MKSLSSSESPRQKSRRKVSKPLMEKRRRERINNSLETLRQLMLENTQNEKLKNSKVEKAEILESVVEFLKTEKEMQRGDLPREQGSTCSLQKSYHDGMRSCLLRVSQFITSKSQDLEGDGAVQGPFAPPEQLAESPGLLHRSPVAAPAEASASLHHLTPQTGSRKLLSPTATAGVPAHISDPVWRPWPE